MGQRDKDDANSRRGAGLKRGFLGTAATAGLTAGASWILYSATMIDHNLPLPLAINSERHLFTSKGAGLLNYYVVEGNEEAGGEESAGRPLVLIHSINAAGSAYEMRPLFEHYRSERPVYALDLPGFGFSERSDRHYSPKMYAAAIRDFLADVVEEPADVIALSLSSEFAARAAVEHPQLFRSLALISPTGLGSAGQQQGVDPAGDDGEVNLLYQAFSFPLWSQPFYDLLATKPSIDYFLKKSFDGPVDEGLAAYAYLTSHQPGARYAPLYFVSGRLFTAGVRREIYEKVEMPALVIYDQDAYTSFDGLSRLLLKRTNWNAVRVEPTRGLPHFEELRTTVRVLDNFWQRIG